MVKRARRERLRIDLTPDVLADLKLGQALTGIRGRGDLVRHALRKLVAQVSPAKETST